MKKSILFLSILMIFALVMFTGCDKAAATSPTAVASFEVVDDSAVEMTYTGDADTEMLKALVIMGMAEEGQTVLQNQVQLTLLKGFLKQAKITEAQIIALVALIEANADLGPILERDLEAIPLTNAEITKILEFYKSAIEIVGNDAAGKLAYQMAIKAAGTDAEAIAEIEAIGYETFVIASRMSFAFVNGLIWSIDAADVEFIAGLSGSTEELTNAEYAQIFDIAGDAFSSIKLSEATWTQFFAIVATKIDNAATLIPEEGEENPTLDQIQVQATAIAKEVLAVLGEQMPLAIKSLGAALSAIDESVLNVFSVKTTEDNWAWDDELNMRVTKYYLDDVEVSEEVYDKHEYKVQAQALIIITSSYNSLSIGDKNKMEAYEIKLLKAMDAALAELAETPYTYTGASSTYAQVMAKATVLAGLNYDTLTLVQIETEFAAAEVILKNFIGANAPHIYELMLPPVSEE